MKIAGILTPHQARRTLATATALGAALTLSCAPTAQEVGVDALESGGCDWTTRTCPPAAPCDLQTLVGSHPSATPYLPIGYSLEAMYDAGTLAAVSPSLPTSLATELAQTWIIRRTTPGITTTEIDALEQNGWTELEWSCPVSAMSTSATERPQRSSSEGDSSRSTTLPPPGVGLSAWHAQQTGASVVAPAIQNLVSGNTELTPIKVVVLDSGVDPAVVPQAVSGWSAFSSASGAWQTDTLGHGTAVASLITDMALGRAQIFAGQVLGAGGRGDTIGLARGLLWGAAQGGRVFNLSLGYPQDEDPSGRLTAFLVDSLAAVHASGGRVMAASGNLCGGPSGTGCDTFLPANAPTSLAGRTLGVNSISGLTAEGWPSDTVVSSMVDVWAPSELICARTTPTASPTQTYRLSGSSFAVPQVSGALVLAMTLKAHQLSVPLVTPAQTDALIGIINMGTPMPSGVMGCVAGNRLDLCSLFEIMTSSPTNVCDAWTSNASPASDVCPWTSWGSNTPISESYTACSASGVSGYCTGTLTPINLDTIEPATWCARLGGSTGRPLCTSCEIEFNGSGGSYSTFNLRLNLAAGWRTTWRDWQLKIVTGTSEIWIPVDVEAAAVGGTLDYTGTLATAITTPADNVYIVARDYIHPEWNGTLLLAEWDSTP